MYPSLLLFLGTAYGLFALFTLFKLFRFGRRDKRLPPGPPTVPILGNAHLISGAAFTQKFKEWSDSYGNVFSLKIGASTLVVLNDRRAVHSLIDKKSAIYSERPIDENMDTVLGNESFAFMHATQRWRAQRKVAAQHLSPKAIDDKIAPIQEAEICQLVYDILVTPDRFWDHMRRVTASTAAIVIFGHRAPTPDDFFGTCVYDTVKINNIALSPGSYLPIDQFPILKYIPDFMAPSKARAKQAYKDSTAIYSKALSIVEGRRQHGDFRDSIADRVLSGEIKMDAALTSSERSNFFLTLHNAAAETTATSLLAGILYLAKSPWVQEKAREELDRICGQRMPNWNDFKDLPYINCIVKEGLRICPVVPLGIPHRVACDDWYDGYLIPKDSTIYIPAYLLNRQCEDPDTYNPDRYINHPRLAMDYAGSPDFMNRDHYAYGSGRRICAGIHLAERTQWRILSRLLWAFKIEPPVDEKGMDVELPLDFEELFLLQPLPYQVRFTPRSDYHAQVIRDDWMDVKDTLKKWE